MGRNKRVQLPLQIGELMPVSMVTAGAWENLAGPQRLG